jgi:SAM-dependent methyltransferase
MKQSLRDLGACNEYRYAQLDRIFDACGKYRIEISDKSVLDLGCSDGTITAGYLERGAKSVVGVDIDDESVKRARRLHTSRDLSFHVGSVASLPLVDRLVDVAICFDVFEHVSQPAAMLDECFRVLKPGGKLLIGTWGWYHPYAPHLWSTMPVPWAHVFVSERTLLRTCRRVYDSPWYVPTMHDLDESGAKIAGRYEHEEISKEYLNKLFVRDFEKLFRQSKFVYRVFPQHFTSRYARWTKVFLRVPLVREFVTAYLCAVPTKEDAAGSDAHGPGRELLDCVSSPALPVRKGIDSARRRRKSCREIAGIGNRLLGRTELQRDQCGRSKRLAAAVEFDACLATNAAIGRCDAKRLARRNAAMATDHVGRDATRYWSKSNLKRLALTWRRR